MLDDDLYSISWNRIFLLVASTLAVTAVSIVIHDVYLWSRLPPGPLPLPFIGNKFDIPKSKPWLQFEQWSKRYGPVFTIWIGRRPNLVISDPQVAVDLMEKRSAKYSSRPRMVVMGEVYNGNASILTQPYGKGWSVRRKLLHQALSPKALELYKPTQEAEAARLCYSLLDNSSAWEKELERFTSSVVFCVAYGHRIDSLDARVISDRFRFMHNMASLNVPGRFMAESFPLLAKIPTVLAPWIKKVRAMGDEEAQANMALLQMVKDDIAAAGEQGAPEKVPDSLCKLLLELRQSEPVLLNEKHFSYIPASLFGAGSDTTASTLCSAFLALVTHQNVLREAQRELDSVVGCGRMPDFADRPRLPYVNAFCKEVLRWRPVAVLGGTPHASTEDDEYKGFFIPSGTTILGNSWSINLNDSYYPQPHKFDPVRFLTTEELRTVGVDKQAYSGIRSHPSKLGHSSFGWGRRICPGADLASNSLFIALARLLWVYDILPCEGMAYDTFAYTDGFNIRPQPFKCIIRIRSSRHRDIIEEEQVRSMAWLERFAPFE